jgi:thiamine-phosphate diphosphorylase
MEEPFPFSLVPFPLMKAPIVMMVTDRRRHDEPLAGLVDASRHAAEAGVDLIQIRESGLDDRALVALADRVREAVSRAGARVSINDRLDIALAVHAAGVHLPALGISCARARGIAPPGFLIGRSVHSEAEAVETEEAGGCDYLILGSIFESASKPTGHPVGGVELLARICRTVRLPVIAIGGITPARVPEVVDAGAAGIAAIGLFARTDRQALGETVGRIREAFRGSKGSSADDPGRGIHGTHG